MLVNLNLEIYINIVTTEIYIKIVNIWKLTNLNFEFRRNYKALNLQSIDFFRFHILFVLHVIYQPF